MIRKEFNLISDMISQVIDDVAGNPDWQKAAEAIACDLGEMERNIERMVK